MNISGGIKTSYFLQSFTQVDSNEIYYHILAVLGKSLVLLEGAKENNERELEILFDQYFYDFSRIVYVLYPYFLAENMKRLTMLIII